MIFTSGSRRVGTLIAFILIAFHGTSTAETVLTINGINIDSSLLDVYAEGRFQKSMTAVTEEERNLIIREVTDIYLLTTQASALTLADTDRVKAQAELQYRGLLAQAVASDYLANNTASEEEIQREYESQIKLAPNLQFKARHILVETQARATELIGQLNDGGDFVQLAKDNSTGPSGPNGGDLGWFSPEQMVPPFSAAVAALEDGSYTQEPVQTQFGWHVILREESRANEPPTLESVRDVIKQRIEQGKFQSYVESLRDSGNQTD